MSRQTFTRRQALGTAGAIVAGPLAGSTLGRGQTTSRPEMGPSGAPRVRPAPRAELVNTLEYEQQAKLTLAPALYALVAGGERYAFDRITLRPRVMVPTLDMNLSLELFGDRLFSPIIVGPMADQKRFHADGEMATVQGASAAKALMIVSSHSSVPLQDLAARGGTPLWYQVFAGDGAAGAHIREAVNARCKAICITVGAVLGTRRAAAALRPDWTAVDALTRGVSVPVVVKGIATPEAATAALQHGVHGIIVSNHGGPAGSSTDALILALPQIVDAVDGKVPVLVDGSFRRGTDVLKALAFGARGVLVGRPVIWGLAAYGADGVQGIVETLQTELARYMGMCGKSNLAMIDRTILKVHAASPNRTRAADRRPEASERSFEGSSRG